MIVGHGVAVIKALSEAGILMEINRLVLHPRGLSLGYEAIDDVPIRIFVSETDDPVGTIFEESVLEESTNRLRAVDERADREGMKKRRLEELGFDIQPLPPVQPAGSEPENA